MKLKKMINPICQYSDDFCARLTVDGIGLFLEVFDINQENCSSLSSSQRVNCILRLLTADCYGWRLGFLRIRRSATFSRRFDCETSNDDRRNRGRDCVLNGCLSVSVARWKIIIRDSSSSGGKARPERCLGPSVRSKYGNGRQGSKGRRAASIHARRGLNFQKLQCGELRLHRTMPPARLDSLDEFSDADSNCSDKQGRSASV